MQSVPEFRKHVKGYDETGDSFAQRNISEIPAVYYRRSLRERGYAACSKEKRSAAKCVRARTERSNGTTGAFIFRSPGRRRIRWCFPRAKVLAFVRSLRRYLLRALSFRPFHLSIDASLPPSPFSQIFFILAFSSFFILYLIFLICGVFFYSFVVSFYVSFNVSFPSYRFIYFPLCYSFCRCSFLLSLCYKFYIIVALLFR